MTLNIWFHLFIYFQVAFILCECRTINHNKKSIADHLVFASLRTQRDTERFFTLNQKEDLVQEILKNQKQSELVRNAIRHQRYPMYSPGLHGVWGLPG